MQHRFMKNAKAILPFLGLSALTGLFAALAGTAFKLGAEWVIHFSGDLYEGARRSVWWIAALILGAAALGLLAACIVSLAQSCKGGGIPTSVAAVRGIASFSWLPSVLVLPFSALVTFLGGVPLGTEGPCVQMGTAIGDGVVSCFGGKKQRPWRRYIMTGGASAGFAIATGAPVTAIFFSVEELHKKFSPLLLTGVCVSVMTAQFTAQLLALWGIGSGSLFHLPQLEALSVAMLLAAALVGAVCGVCSVYFTRFYHLVEKKVRALLKKCSVKLVFPLLFAAVCGVGLCFADALGTGHGLVDALFEGYGLWYLLILAFLLRMIFMMVANTAGVTGGVFLPTLAFGGILGALCAQGLTALGLLEQQYYLPMVILGVTAFLGATSRIPLTACVFALEALSCGNNMLAVIVAVTVAFAIAELSGVEDFTDAVIGAKERAMSKGTQPEVVEKTLTVQEASFAVGKKSADILWPNALTVVAVEHGHHGEELQAGDLITVRYKTYDAAFTAAELTALVGSQE